MLTAILALFQAVPAIFGGVNNFVNKYYDAKVQITMARFNADRDKAVAILQNSAAADHEATQRLSVIASNPVLTFLMVGFASPIVIFMWKVIVVDNVLGPGCVYHWCWVGETLPIKGQVGDWMGTIIVSLFGSGTAMFVTKAWFSKDRPNAP